MVGIVITGHGTFASGIRSMVDLVLGEQENIRYVDFLESYSSEDISKALEHGIRDVDTGSGVVVMADLAGGTPFNTAVMLQGSISGSIIKVLGGVNIPMVIQGVELSEDSHIDGIAAEIMEGAVEGIVEFDVSGNAPASVDGADSEGI